MHNLNRFVSKHSNHKPIGIEILYICFRCLQRKQLRIEPFCSASLISNVCLPFAQLPAQPMLLPLQTYHLCCTTLKTSSFVAFYHFVSTSVNHPYLAHWLFSPSYFNKPLSLVRDFCLFRITASNFQHYDLLILPTSVFRRIPNTNIKFAPIQFFYS